MHKNYGSKRVVTGAHYGLRDWLVQRVTAVLMALYVLTLLVQVLLIPSPILYVDWASIFGRAWMKYFTFVIVLALAWHAWVGVRDIWMDYVKPVSLRLVLHVGTLVWLVACAGWAVQVLWRI